MKTQKLKDVCNGFHIHDLGYAYYDITPQSICIIMVNKIKSLMDKRKETKAILVLENKQPTAKALNMLMLDSDAHKRYGITAKKLCKWSDSANLWMVRTDNKW